jgi:hypothetical protein
MRGCCTQCGTQLKSPGAWCSPCWQTWQQHTAQRAAQAYQQSSYQALPLRPTPRAGPTIACCGAFHPVTALPLTVPCCGRVYFQEV